MPVRKWITEVSEDAQTLYRQALKESGCSIQGADFKPEWVGLAKELQEAGLASYSVSNWSGEDHHYLWVTPLARFYTTAEGRGNVDAVVTLIGNPKNIVHTHRDNLVLAYLKNASLERRDSNSMSFGEMWRLTVKHPTATDFEHDPMYLADFWIANLQLAGSNAADDLVFTGVLSEEPNLYGFGVDPFDPDYSASGDYSERDECEGGGYYGEDHKPHPFGPYMPPKVPGLANRLVTVTISELRSRREEA